MDAATLVSIGKTVADLAKQFAGNPAAQKTIDLLKTQVQVLEGSIRVEEKKVHDLEAKVVELTMERDKLREQLAAVHLETEESIVDGLLLRTTPGGEQGPFCPNH